MSRRPMAISGSLQDVSVADVMQFIHLGRRTGTLLLSREAERAMIGFHGGKLVSAQAPRTPKLGDLLVQSGMIDRAALAQAIEDQGREKERRSLGQILIGSGAIEPQGLRDVIARQIEQAVAEVMVWDTGTFEFAIDDLRPIDDIALYPSDVLPDADINTQMVLLEAARIFDERSRNAASETDPQEVHRGRPPLSGDDTHPSLAHAAAGQAVAPPAEDEDDFDLFGGHHGAEPLRLQVVSTDQTLVDRLARALAEHVRSVGTASLAQAGLVPAGEPSPIVLVDVRRGGATLDQMSAIRKRRPGAAVAAVVDPGTPFTKVYAAGALAAVPPDVDAVVACVENILESRRQAPAGGGEEGKGGVARLRRVFGDLRSGLISATVALNLMHIISESVERAVLFLVKRDQLVALGAFGTDANGKPLAELTRGLRLSLAPGDADDANVLTQSLERGEAQALGFEDARLPEPFRSLVGRPRNGQVVVFPVLGAQRVISIIYADNGEREEPVEDIDILELATAQVGMAFENELLRRQISQKG